MNDNNEKQLAGLTKRRLIKWHREVEELQKQDSIIPFLLRTKLNEFYQKNAVRINTIKEGMNEIIQKHRVCDDKGNPYSAGDKAVMKEGCTWEGYTQEMNAYLDQEINIILP